MVGDGRDQGAQEERGPAVHHLHAAAGLALPGQADDADRAAALRGHRAAVKAPSASSPTCAPTRRASPTTRSPTCASTSARRYGADTCRRSRTSTRRRQSAGRARSDPPDVDAVPPGAVRAQLTPEQYDLYRLIWDRFVASQMTPAIFDDTTVDVDSGRRTSAASRDRSRSSPAGWRSTTGAAPRTRTAGPGQTRRRAEDDDGASVLPPLNEGEVLELKELDPEQHFTQPPPRYTEATLVKALEENGIGRPSTYASIIGVIQAREYVDKNEGKFKPTPRHDARREAPQAGFHDIMDVKYTRGSRRSSTRSKTGRRYEKTRRASTRSSRRT